MRRPKAETALCITGRLDAEEVVPEDADFDPSKSAQGSTLVAPQPYSNPPPGAEATLQALDHAFGRAPLSMMGSLSGILTLRHCRDVHFPLTKLCHHGRDLAVCLSLRKSLIFMHLTEFRQMSRHCGRASCFISC